MIHPKLNKINIIIEKSGAEPKKIPVLSTMTKDYIIYKDYQHEPAWNKDSVKVQQSSSSDKFNNKFGSDLFAKTQ